MLNVLKIHGVSVRKCILPLSCKYNIILTVFTAEISLKDNFGLKDKIFEFFVKTGRIFEEVIWDF